MRSALAIVTEAVRSVQVDGLKIIAGPGEDNAPGENNVVYVSMESNRPTEVIPAGEPSSVRNESGPGRKQNFIAEYAAEFWADDEYANYENAAKYVDALLQMEYAGRTDEFFGIDIGFQVTEGMDSDNTGKADDGAWKYRIKVMAVYSATSSGVAQGLENSNG